MRRRALLSVLGTSSLGTLPGCSAASTFLNAPDIATAEIAAHDRVCSDSPTETATIQQSSGIGTWIEITGSIAVPRIRDTLSVAVQNGVGKPERGDADMEVHIDFGPADPAVNTGVPAREGQIDYRAEIELTRAPTAIIVRHTVEEGDSGALKTVTTETMTR